MTFEQEERGGYRIITLFLDIICECSLSDGAVEGRLRAVVAVDVGVQGIEPLLIFAQLYGCGGGGGLAADAELRDQGLDAGHALVDLRMRLHDSHRCLAEL